MNAGIDEAGKGCIFGNVYASCVIWDDEITHKLLTDSKKLTKNNRLIMFDFITDNAIDYGIGFSNSTEIDTMNISKANTLAMHRAIDELNIEPEQLLVDGIVFSKYKNIPHTCVIHGDSIYQSISAASILAKVSHDDHINNLLINNPNLEKYNLHTNMGYATKQHCEAVEIYGRTEYHRKSFKLPFEKHN